MHMLPQRTFTRAAQLGETEGKFGITLDAQMHTNLGDGAFRISNLQFKFAISHVLV